MQKLHKYISHFILSVVDWFYPMFQKLMPKQTYRYAACGGFNTFLDIGLFFIAYNYILAKSTVQLGNIIISGHIASFYDELYCHISYGLLFEQVCRFSGNFGYQKRTIG
jgi:hypothetical protein